MTVQNLEVGDVPADRRRAGYVESQCAAPRTV
jgi:hypothetical protein